MNNDFYLEKANEFTAKIMTCMTIKEYTLIRREFDKFLDIINSFNAFQNKFVSKHNVIGFVSGTSNVNSEMLPSHCVQKQIGDIDKTFEDTFNHGITFNSDANSFINSINPDLQYFNLSQKMHVSQGYYEDVILVDNQGYEVNYSPKFKELYTNPHDKLCFEIYERTSIAYNNFLVHKFEGHLCKNVPIRNRLYLAKFVCEHDTIAIKTKSGKNKYFIRYCASKFCNDGFEEFKDIFNAKREQLKRKKEIIKDKTLSINEKKRIIKNFEHISYDTDGCVNSRYRVCNKFFEKYRDSYGCFKKNDNGKYNFIADKYWGYDARWIHDVINFGSYKMLDVNILNDIRKRSNLFLDGYKRIITDYLVKEKENELGKSLTAYKKEIICEKERLLNRKLTAKEKLDKNIFDKKFLSSITPKLKALGQYDETFDKNTKEFKPHVHFAVFPYKLRLNYLNYEKKIRTNPHGITAKDIKDYNNAKEHLKNIADLCTSLNCHHQTFGLKKLGALCRYFATRKAGIYHYSGRHSDLYLSSDIMTTRQYIDAYFGFHTSFHYGWSKQELKYINKITEEKLLNGGLFAIDLPVLEKASLCDASILYTTIIRVSKCPVCNENHIHLVKVTDKEFRESDYSG